MDFFENLGKKLSKTYDVAADKTEKVTRHAKLKISISDMKDKIQEEYAKIGEKVYIKYLDHRDDDVALGFIDEFKAVDKYNEKIKSAEKEILELKDLKKCAKCGEQFEDKFEYCPKCGAKYGEVVYETEIVNKEEE